MQLALFRSQEIYKVFVQKGTICQLVPFSPHLFLNQHEHLGQMVPFSSHLFMR